LHLPLLSHIDDLIIQIGDLASEVDKIPYFKVRRFLEKSIENYEKGLKIMKEGLIECVLKKAELHAKSQTKHGEVVSPEEVIYTVYNKLISSNYSIAERFNTDVKMLVQSSLPSELYHWLLEIPEYFRIDKLIVFQDSQRFISETFDDRILRPLKSLIELAKKPEVKGSLEQLKPIDITKLNPIEDGYIVCCIRGEAQNPILWPVLCHEMFEIVDKEQKLFKHFERFVSSKGNILPSLDDDMKTNLYWISEILMDFLAINSFGPMFVKSLIEYFKRAPTYETPLHPPPSFRLFCVFQYLRGPINIKTDILGKCQLRAKRDVELELRRYGRERKLDNENEKRLLALYKLMAQFLETIKAATFSEKLTEFIEQSANPAAKLDELLKGKDESNFVPFQDPLPYFEDIKNAIFHHHVSLAIRPEIMLNVVLANYDLYRKNDHLSVIVDSIKKWKIKQNWNSAIEAFQKDS